MLDDKQPTGEEVALDEAKNSAPLNEALLEDVNNVMLLDGLNNVALDETSSAPLDEALAILTEFYHGLAERGITWAQADDLENAAKPVGFRNLADKRGYDQRQAKQHLGMPRNAYFAGGREAPAEESLIEAAKAALMLVQTHVKPTEEGSEKVFVVSTRQLETLLKTHAKECWDSLARKLSNGALAMLVKRLVDAGCVHRGQWLIVNSEASIVAQNRYETQAVASMAMRDQVRALLAFLIEVNSGAHADGAAKSSVWGASYDIPADQRAIDLVRALHSFGCNYHSGGGKRAIVTITVQEAAAE